MAKAANAFILRRTCLRVTMPPCCLPSPLREVPPQHQPRHHRQQRHEHRRAPHSLPASWRRRCLRFPQRHLPQPGDQQHAGPKPRATRISSSVSPLTARPKTIRPSSIADTNTSAQPRLFRRGVPFMTGPAKNKERSQGCSRSPRNGRRKTAPGRRPFTGAPSTAFPGYKDLAAQGCGFP